MRRRLRELAVLVAVGGLMMAGCSSSDKKASVTDAQGKNVAESQSQDEGSKKVTFVLKSLGSNYWVQLKAGAVDKAEELGIDLEVLAPSSDNATEDQIRMLEDQVVSGVDLVLVAPSNSGAQVATFDKVVDAGIPLICVDTNAKDYDKKTSFIGSSNEEVGKKAGEYLTENVKDKSGAVILLRGQLGDETADTRSKGCTDALKAAGFSNIVEQPANNDRNTAMGVMENMLQSNDNIVAVYATNDEMALGAARALQAATLGMQNVARGLALIVTGAAPVSSFPKSVQFLGNSMVGVVPMSIIFVAIVAVVFYIFLNRTAIGKHIYAIGGNAEAAKLSGINIDKTIIIVYTICGFMAALGGIVQMGRVDSAFPLAGTGYELNAVASVVIGGASMKGGSGTVSGTIIGAMVIAVLNNGLNLLHVSTYAQQIALGIVIIGAVYVDVLRERLGSKAKKN